MTKTWIGWRGLTAVVLLAALPSACTQTGEQAAARRIQRGDRYFQTGRYMDAVIEYRGALQDNPRSGEAYRKLGETYAKAGDSPSAQKAYISAADLLPSDDALQLAAANYQVAGGRFDEARKRLAVLLKRDPANIDAHILSGLAQLGLKDPDGAIRDIENAIGLDPTAMRSYTVLGAVHLSQAQNTKAEEAFNHAIELAPTSATPYVALGYYFWSQTRLADAEAQFKKALVAEPGSAAANRAMMVLCRTTNRRSEAEPYLKALAEHELSAEFELADYYLEMNRPNDAIKVLEQLQTDPRISKDATIRLAAMKFNLGAKADANTLVDGVLARDPGNPIALVAKAQMLLSANRLDEALACATAAARADHGNALALFVIGNIQTARNDVPHAIAAYNDVLKANPRAVPAHMRIATLLLARRDFDGARTAVVSGLALQPQNEQLRLMLVRVHMGSNRLEDADRELQQLNHMYPNSADVQALTGRLRAATRNVTAARQAYERALVLDKSNWEAFEGLVLLDFQSGQPDEARRLLDARLAGNPADSAALVLMARTYFASGALDAAEPYLKKAIDAEPGNLVAYELLGTVYLQTKRLDEARIQYEAAVKRAPRLVPANLMLGVVLEAQHRTDEAMRQYQHVLELDPTAVVASNNLAWLHIQRGDNPDVALALALQAKQLRPSDPTVNDTLGWIYLKKNQTNDAVRLLEQAVQGESKNPVHHYHLGMAYLKRGDDQEGRSALERALTLDPNFAGADAARAALADI